MKKEQWEHLDKHLRLQLGDLPSQLFERFFLDFFGAGISVTINRNGRAVTKRVIAASMYASGGGRKQKGIDLRMEMQGGEIWITQCKCVKKWTLNETKDAIEKANGYPANHYLLAVACDTPSEVHEEIARHSNWTLWNIESICAEFRRLIPTTKRKPILSFLSPDQVRRFLPFHTESLISPENFFSNKSLRHDFPLVGRVSELNKMKQWREGEKKILLLEAPGGQGKSRLLKEFSNLTGNECPDTELLFLNANREESNFSFALDGSSKKIVIIDDAHRNDCSQLLALIRQDNNIKAILSLRSHGDQFISSALWPSGFSEDDVEPVKVETLSKKDARILAKYALNTDDPEQINRLAEFAKANPFLITVAGSAFQTAEVWQSLSRKQFRHKVFIEFEKLNLDVIPAEEREPARRLLRLISILSPVDLNSEFFKMAETLIAYSFVQRISNLLRQVGLVVQTVEGYQVTPDLFADFLVYETCFDPDNSETDWVKRILHSLPLHCVEILKNLAEASWIAHLNGVQNDELLRSLFASVRDKFLTLSFVDRSELLRKWIPFGVYIPRETLEIAKLAIDSKSAPPYAVAGFEEINFHKFVIRRIPFLISPIAEYHPTHCFEALDLLWHIRSTELCAEASGKTDDLTVKVMVGVFELDSQRTLESFIGPLKWLRNKVKNSKAFQAMLERGPLLRFLLRGCFSRFVDSSWSEGRTFFIRANNISIEKTQPIRDLALEIIRWVIENGIYVEVVDALGSLESAIEEVGIGKIPEVKNLAELQKLWLPERLKALQLFRLALGIHSDSVIRYQIYKTLRQVGPWQQPEFQADVLSIIDLIPMDLSLRVTIALFHDYFSKFTGSSEEKESPDWYERARERWSKSVEKIASELAETYPDVTELYLFLNNLVGKLKECGFSPSAFHLLSCLTSSNPNSSQALAHHILFQPESHLAKEFVALGGIDQNERSDLWIQAKEGKNPEIVSSVIAHLAFLSACPSVLSERDKTLLSEIAKRATEKEILGLLDVIENASKENVPWALELLSEIHLAEITLPVFDALLGALAPYQERSVNLAPEKVARIFGLFLDVPDLKFNQHQLEWHRLRSAYPNQVFQLLRERTLLAESRKDSKYMPVPYFSDGRWSFPELGKHCPIQQTITELWDRVTAPDKPYIWWSWLFQAVVFDHDPNWVDRLLKEIENATLIKKLEKLAYLIKYDGSLVIFNFPNITKAFLNRADEIGSKEELDEIQSALYNGSGPRIRSFINGEAESDTDYLEASALKAAEAYALDDKLGPFFRWIVSIEQQRRKAEKLRVDRTIEDS